MSGTVEKRTRKGKKKTKKSGRAYWILKGLADGGRDRFEVFNLRSKLKKRNRRRTDHTDQRPGERKEEDTTRDQMKTASLLNKKTRRWTERGPSVARALLHAKPPCRSPRTEPMRERKKDRKMYRETAERKNKRKGMAFSRGT